MQTELNWERCTRLPARLALLRVAVALMLQYKTQRISHSSVCVAVTSRHTSYYTCAVLYRMASDLPKHSLGASANIRAQLGRLDQKSWTPDSPFLINAPNSERADVTGLQTGALIADNAVQAEILKPLQSDLQEKSGVDIGLTYFQNWGDTQESLLLYAKPKTVLEVQNLVGAAADPEINIKVRYHRILMPARKDFTNVAFRAEILISKNFFL